MKCDPPGARANLSGEAGEERGAREQRILRRGRVELGAEVVLERHQHLGRRLLGHHGVVGRRVARGIGADPGVGIARRALAAADVEPVVRVDLVVDDEVGDPSVPVLAVVAARQHAGEAAVIGGVRRGAEDLVARRDRRAAGDAGPRGHAVDDGGHDDSLAGPFGDCGVDGGVDREAMAVLLFLGGGIAGRRLRGALQVAQTRFMATPPALLPAISSLSGQKSGWRPFSRYAPRVGYGSGPAPPAPPAPELALELEPPALPEEDEAVLELLSPAPPVPELLAVAAAPPSPAGELSVTPPAQAPTSAKAATGTKEPRRRAGRGTSARIARRRRCCARTSLSESPADERSRALPSATRTTSGAACRCATGASASRARSSGSAWCSRRTARSGGSSTRRPRGMGSGAMRSAFSPPRRSSPRERGTAVRWSGSSSRRCRRSRATRRRALARIVGRSLALFSWLGVSDLHWENLVLGVDARGHVVFAPLDVEMILADLSLPTETKLLPDADPEYAEICRHASGVRRVLPYLGKPVDAADLLAMAGAYRSTLAFLDRSRARDRRRVRAPARPARDAHSRVPPRDRTSTCARARSRRGRRCSTRSRSSSPAATSRTSSGLYGRPGIHYYGDRDARRGSSDCRCEGDVPQLEPLLSLSRGLRSPSRKKLREEGLFTLLGAFDHASFVGRHASDELEATFGARTLVREAAHGRGAAHPAKPERVRRQRLPAVSLRRGPLGLRPAGHGVRGRAGGGARSGVQAPERRGSR